MKLTRILAAAALAAAALPAAARAQAGTPAAPPPRVIDGEEGLRIRLGSEGATVIESRIAAPADSVWAALPEVMRGMGIAPQVAAGGERTVGNRRITTARVAGERTTRYVTCGNEGAGPGAASGVRVVLAVVARVEPQGAGRTRLLTSVTGTPSSVQGGASVVAGCASTGILEQKLADAVAARLGVTP